MDADIERRQAIIDLLSIPDAPYVRRSHRLTHAGKADRFELLPRLAAIFVQQKLLELRERDAARVVITTH